MARTKIDVSLINPVTSSLNMDGNKITNLANGTASTDAAAFGQIPQFATAVQATTTTGTSTTSATFVDANISASITPLSASHRVKITINVACGGTTSGIVGILGISSAGSDIFTTVSTPWRFRTFDAGGQPEFVTTLVYVDNPNTTSSVTYKLRAAVVGGNTILLGGSLATGLTTTMLLEEIA